VSKRSELDPSLKNRLQVSCSISGREPNAILSISFRTKVQDISQKLGSLELSQTKDTDDVDLFGWACQLADSHDSLDAEVVAQQQDADVKSEMAKALQKQLDDLIKAKSEHETELLSKFAVLLNEKKLQLRKLNRVLETAKVDPKKIQEIEPTKGGRSSEAQKRKVSDGEDSDDSEAFDNMDIDGPVATGPGKDEDDRSRDTTPDDTDSQEDDDLDHAQPPPTRSQAKKKSPPAHSSPERSIPARRELPSSKFKTSSKSQQNTSIAESTEKGNNDDDDEETASEDDEL
jgi:hypothetical protein